MQTRQIFCYPLIRQIPKSCILKNCLFMYCCFLLSFAALDMWGLPVPGIYTTYGGGGYMAFFDINLNNSVRILNELYENIWLDRHSRAVMFDFTLFNGNTNTLIYSLFTVEFPETGGAITSYTILPLRVYHHHGPLGTYILVCECALVIYLIVLFSKICLRFYQQGWFYFKKLWQVFELVKLIVGLTGVVLYFIKLTFTILTISKVNEDKKSFVSFQHIAFWDQAYILILSVLVFMSTIHILQVFETSRKINAVVKIFSNCMSDLFWFGMMFLYIIVAFCVLGTLLFGSYLVDYRNVFQTMGKLFISLIGKSNYREINTVSPILANIFFLAYILCAVFFVMTLFLSILGGSIDTVIHDTRKNDAEDFMHILISQLTSLLWGPKKNTKSGSESKTENNSIKPISKGKSGQKIVRSKLTSINPMHLNP